MAVRDTAPGGLRRMDLKEWSDTLRSLARGSMQAAFRYQRRASESPALSLAWTRFPDAGVLAATAQDAVATTLVTSEGRSLTEIKLTVRNQAQPFLKVTLPAGATSCPPKWRARGQPVEERRAAASAAPAGRSRRPRPIRYRWFTSTGRSFSEERVGSSSCRRWTSGRGDGIGSLPPAAVSGVGLGGDAIAAS